MGGAPKKILKPMKDILVKNYRSPKNEVNDQGEWAVPLQKIMVLKQKFSFTTKNKMKQNISQTTSRFRQLLRITGL
jgi:hypothetical protein